MRVHLGTDHAGFELKQHLVGLLAELGHEVIDHGAPEYDEADDYPVYCLRAAEAVVADPGSLGIVIGESAYRGKGYGTDAINAILDFAFGELGLERVSLSTLADNQAGQHAFEKAGFKLEGTARNATFNRGKFRDNILMGVVRADWDKLKRKRSWDFSDADGPKPRRKGTGFRKE